MARIVLLRAVDPMPLRSGRSQWLISMAFFAAILLALVIAALMLNPLATTIP